MKCRSRTPSLEEYISKFTVAIQGFTLTSVTAAEKQSIILDSTESIVNYIEVGLGFRKGMVRTDSIRTLCTRIFASRAYEALFSGSKGHFSIGSFAHV